VELHGAVARGRAGWISSADFDVTAAQSAARCSLAAAFSAVNLAIDCVCRAKAGLSSTAADSSVALNVAALT
jgi:hypothetical protein